MKYFEKGKVEEVEIYIKSVLDLVLIFNVASECGQTKHFLYKMTQTTKFDIAKNLTQFYIVTKEPKK